MTADLELRWSSLLVRHASAGKSSAWPGADRDRPLDDLGRAQAAALVPVLEAHGVVRLVSADLRRCIDTLAVYAATRRIVTEREDLLSEAGYVADPELALEWVLGLIDPAKPVAVCSQGQVLPDLVRRMCGAYDAPAPSDTSIRKGCYWVVRFAQSGTRPRLVGLELFDPLGQPAAKSRRSRREGGAMTARAAGG